MRKTDKKIIKRPVKGLRLTAAALLLAAILAPSAYAAEAGSAKEGYGPAWEIEHKSPLLQTSQTAPVTTGDAARAGDSAQTAQTGQTADWNGDVNTLKTAAQTDKLIIVVGNPSDPAKSVLTYYERGADGKLQTVFTSEAVSGMNGISADKTEGDKKTPQGVYSFTMAFGMKDDPGSLLPYRKVRNGDNFVDDQNSRYYNRYVNEFEVAKDWNSAENLIRQAPHYNYALVLNYNEACTPGKGSAIFLHCPKIANNTGTSGCISIPEERMKELVQKVDQNAKIIVAPEEKWLAQY